MIIFFALLGVALSFPVSDPPVTAGKWIDLWKIGEKDKMLDSFFESDATMQFGPDKIYTGDEDITTELRSLVEKYVSSEDSGKQTPEVTRVVAFQNTHLLLPPELNTSKDSCGPYDRGFVVQWLSKGSIGGTSATGLDVVVLSPEGKIQTLVMYMFKVTDAELKKLMGGTSYSKTESTDKDEETEKDKSKDKTPVKQTRSTKDSESDDVTLPLLLWMQKLAMAWKDALQGDTWLESIGRMVDIVATMSKATSTDELAELYSDDATLFVNGKLSFSNKKEIVSYLDKDVKLPYPPHYIPLFVPFTDYGKPGFIVGWVVPKSDTDDVCEAKKQGVSIVLLDPEGGLIDSEEIFKFE